MKELLKYASGAAIGIVVTLVILDLLVKTGAETPQKQENATL